MSNQICPLLFFVLFLFSCQSVITAQKQHTAQSNVSVIEEPFKMNNLDRERQIRIHLPPGYEESSVHYPVLYMHDGQNLFDDFTSYVGEWEVDETLNKLSEKNRFDIIVVGIDNGQEKRINEMSAWKHEKYGEPEGKEYMEFIVSQVKPYIDEHYRTKPERIHTGLIGSSLGGLITHFALYKYPEVFSKAGIFSPSYWFTEQIFQETERGKLPEDARIYMIVGSEEGKSMVEPAQKMYKVFVDSGHPSENLKFEIVKDGTHSEGFWGSQFESAVSWLFAGDGDQ